MPAASVPPITSTSTFNMNVLKLYTNGAEPSALSGSQGQCCCTIEALVKDNSKLDQHNPCSSFQYTDLGQDCSSNHNHEHFCHLHGPQSDGFVQTERRLTYNLLLLSLTSSIALGVVYTLISLDRYFFGPWTFLGLSAAFLIGALSVYYAQACVTRFGPNRVLALATCSIIFYVFVHFFSSFVLFQLGVIVLALCLGPFYCAQLEFISHFTSRLVHLTASIKRHQEERSHRLLHLLLFCPSHIVGHLIFVVLSISYARMSGDTTRHPDNHANQYNLSPNYNHYSSGIGYPVQIRQSQLPHNLTEPRLEPCSTPSCLSSGRMLDLSPVEWQSQTNPWCARQFDQQVCHQAMYYIFSFNRYQHELIENEAVKPFAPNFAVLLLSVFLLVSVSALIIVLLLLNRTEHLQVQDPLERSFLSSSIRNVLFRTLHDHHLRLLLPMAFFVGLEQGFFIADFNKLYVSCALGLDAIGLVMLTRGCVHLGATLLVHEFVRHIHRPLILLSGAICQLGVLAILCLWRPNDDLPLYYVITACWALSNAIWETLLLTNILRTFCSEEWNYALLTVYSFTSLGLGASFGVSEFVCLYIKLYGLMGALVVAIVPMKICELRLVRLEKILGPGSASQV